jgi:hypothetical protein
MYWASYIAINYHCLVLYKCSSTIVYISVSAALLTTQNWYMLTYTHR